MGKYILQGSRNQSKRRCDEKKGRRIAKEDWQ